MIPGISGTLLSIDALEQAVPSALRGMLGEGSRVRARRRLATWHTPLRSQLGPASAPRTIFDRLAVPLFAQLGYSIIPAGTAGDECDPDASHLLLALLAERDRALVSLVVSAWGRNPSGLWREAVRLGIANDTRWCCCFTGSTIRLVDSQRTYSRQFVELDLPTSIDDERSFAVLWGLLRAEAMAGTAADRRPLLERAVAVSESHRIEVRSSLQSGVDEALVHLDGALARAARSRARASRRAPSSPVRNTFSEALIVVYRILFLLFAEARGLVPAWHPVIRDGYTIEALRGSAEIYPRPRGLWEALQSIARLAHRGCRIGALRVTPFNGRLFSPIESPLADTLMLDEGAVRQALMALTTRRTGGGRQRIAYGDLGVEQLGAVYERILDLEPAAGAPGTGITIGRSKPPLLATGRRKATGSFYTPRSLTEYLVRRALAPLVSGRSADQVLAIRVLDPAMGSGAFLVAACRYLSAAYEAALCRDGGFVAGDFDEADRASFRRAVAQRCLYGVDVNPMAVQLGRLSLWLATLAADRPLTFLDHRLRSGNSLVGAGMNDIVRSPRTRAGRRRADSALPLFDDPAATAAIRDAIDTREAIATEPGETLAQVRSKEQALARLSGAHGPMATRRAICDLWCATWFAGNDRRTSRAKPPAFGALLDALLGRGALPSHVASPFLDAARDAAKAQGFFHWPLEFPEILHDGNSARDLGFDAVIGNPPWEMLRGDRSDTDDAAARSAAKAGATRLMEFARTSGTYTLQGDGHLNLYQLFLERMLALVRRGGRLAAIVPSGLATDHGAAHLRRHLLDRTSIDTLVSIENRDGLFPIHRGVKFLLLCATQGADRPSSSLPCRFGVRRPDDLDRLSELEPDARSIVVPRALVERVSGHGLAIPDVRSRDDLEILGHCALMVPALGDREGWNVHFGRELNATDDKRHFRKTATKMTMPVIEGKLLSPFGVDIAGATQHLPTHTAAAILDAGRTYGRARLAYREVAASTNRLTLIAAIVPPDVVTTHTVFCVREHLEEDGQIFLCGMFNSFVANYLVRLRVTTHVNAAIIERLRVPRPCEDSPEFREIVVLATRLLTNPQDSRAGAALQARAARAYGLTRNQFAYVLETFPLIPRADRDAAPAAFGDGTAPPFASG